MPGPHGSSGQSKAFLLTGVLIQLQPEVGQDIRGVIDVFDLFFPADPLLLIIQRHGDPVIGFLLPVQLTGCPGSGPVGIGSIKFRSHLTELVLARNHLFLGKSLDAKTSQQQ